MEIFQLNESYNSFVSRYGVDPNGLLMSEDTFFNLYEKGMVHFDAAGNSPTIINITIYRSHQMKNNEIKFVL